MVSQGLFFVKTTVFFGNANAFLARRCFLGTPMLSWHIYKDGGTWTGLSSSKQ
jgi:hypothetical protein